MLQAFAVFGVFDRLSNWLVILSRLFLAEGLFARRLAA